MALAPINTQWHLHLKVGCIASLPQALPAPATPQRRGSTAAALAAVAFGCGRGVPPMRRVRCRAAVSPFEITEVPSKGLGAVATRDIKEGEVVVEERPPITYVDGPDWERKIQEQFEALPAKTQEALMRLHDVNEDKTLTGIFNTNSIGCYSETLDGSLCVVVSRFNHSCLPNCEQFWDDELFRQKLFACQDIRKGEELCFSYVEPFLSFGQRSRIFEERYAFQCRCPACTTSTDASDLRRGRLGELMKQLNRGVNADGDAGVGLAEEMQQLCEAEGLTLQGFRAQAAYHAFQCLLLARRPEEAGRWIRSARQALQCSRGPEHPDVEVLRGYERDPLSHPAATDQQIDWSSLAAVGLAAAGAVAFTQGSHD